MNPLVIQIYQSTVTKYIKFRQRLDKNISSGKFKQFTKRRQGQLLHKIERLRRRILQLQTQLKLASAGVALSLFLNTAPAQAQTTVGPFVRNYFENPLPPPLRHLDSPAPVYVDMDNDGDLDLIVGNEYSHILLYFKNIGTQTDPFFLEIKQGETGYPFENISIEIGSNRGNWVPAFADIDGDLDFDLLIGTDKYTPIYDGEVHFFRNTGSANSPAFTFETGATNPFNGISSVRHAHPTFVDFDLDGDKDLILGGYYSASTNNYIIQYFKNTGTATAPVFEYSPVVPEIYSLINSVNNYYNAYAASNAFADLDGDGDLDFFFAENGNIHYRRNDGGTFQYEYAASNQTGPWMPNVANPGSSIGNPFNSVNVITPQNFTFADLDNDGDLDVTVGYYTDNPPFPYEVRPFLYYENVGRGVLQLRTGVDSPLDGVDVGENCSSSFADIDADGDIDILAWGYVSEIICPDGCYEIGNELVSVFRNTAGSFVDVTDDEGSKFTGLASTFAGARQHLIKVDNDNIPELVIAYFQETAPIGGKIQYFKLEGGVYVEKTGAQNPFNNIQIVGRVINLSLGDLNDDQLPDLILGITDDRLQTFRNTGTAADPAFTRETTWETGFQNNLYYESNPKLLDLDHDADLDIIVGKYDNIWYYENTGTAAAPTFVELNEINNLNPFRSIDIINTPSPNFYDVDADGDEDLIFGDGQGQFQYYENQNPVPSTTVDAAALNSVGGTPIIIDPALTIADPDNDAIVRATISIQSFQTGNEILAFTPQAGITGTFNTSTGVLTLTGKATLATYQSVLRTVTHNFTGTVPGGKKSESGKAQSIARTISIQVFDTDFTTPVIGTRTINVAAPNAAPIIVPESLTVDAGSDVTINIFPLITDTDGNFTPSPSTITIVQQPTSGASASLIFISASVVNLVVDYSGISFSGEDQLQIQACDDLGACTLSTISIEVNAVASEIIVYNAFSPNGGDNINSFFNIRYIEVVSPENKVTIYNRWGDSVFEITNYNNTTRKFEGQSDNGKELPTGTYFYKIEATGKTLTGYLSLKR